LIVGGGSETPDPKITPEIGRLQAIAEREGIADRVVFTGRRGREVLRYYYSAADVFISTPWYEPFGITPVEAMACGTPVIGSDVGGIKYTVVDNVTGFLVPPREPEILAERLEKLYRHPEQLKGMVAVLGPRARSGLPADAAAFGEAVLIAVPYGALPQVGRDLAPLLKGKVVLDACNAVPSRDGAVAEEAKANGIGLTSQKYLPGTRLVRAFNTLGSSVLRTQSNRPEPRLPVPIAGDDVDALKVAAGLVRDAGFDAVIVGPLARASEFAMGAPGYGQHPSAAALKRVLSLAP
jgi:predicted dinucleotide-binding enzyme